MLGISDLKNRAHILKISETLSSGVHVIVVISMAAKIFSYSNF